MEIEYDRVLTEGGREDVERYLDDAEVCVIVDWREEDDSVVNDFAAKISETDLQGELTDRGLTIKHDGKDSEILYDSLKDRYVTIQKIAELLKDKYEIRVFESSLGSDTHVFYIKPRRWWNFMDTKFAKRMKQIFVPIDGISNFDEANEKFASGEQKTTVS